MIELTWEDPPRHDSADVPTRGEIAQALRDKPRTYAVVGRHDRAARAAAHVERITSGREYGDGFDAVARRVGNEHRVYAQYAKKGGAR